MFAIGDFSRISGLSVKALRLYHEREILVPTAVDPGSGYRYYDASSVDRARAVVHLRELGFSLNELKELLENYDDEADIVEFLERQKEVIGRKIRELRSTTHSLDAIIRNEKEAKMAMQNSSFEVEEKQLETLLIAGVRMKGKYSDMGKGFSKVCRSMGRHICGKPLALHYDGEYKEDDADFEPCVPVRKGKQVEGISVRELPGGKCVALIHKGPYDELGRSYEKLLAHAKEKGYEVQLPTREVYLKGPGMIFKGNPKNYLTELQLLVK